MPFLTLVGPNDERGRLMPALSKEQQRRCSVRLEEDKGHARRAYRIRLAGTADQKYSDAEVCEWAKWFSTEYGPVLNRKDGGQGLHIKEMDFSGNMLGDEALEAVLAAVAGLAWRIESVKFHHNKLTRGDGVMQLLQRGVTHQLHLSHNLLPDEEMAALVRAAVQATDSQGKAYYPLRQTLPLWLRLEHNPGHGGPLTTAAIREGEARICLVNMNTGRCTPFACWKQQKSPAVHLTYLDQLTSSSSASCAREGARKKTAPRDAPCITASSSWTCAEKGKKKAEKAQWKPVETEELGIMECRQLPSAVVSAQSASQWLEEGGRRSTQTVEEEWLPMVLSVVEAVLSRSEAQGEEDDR